MIWGRQHYRAQTITPQTTMLSARKVQTFVPLKACLGKMHFTKILSQQNLKFSLKIFFSFNQMKAFFPFCLKHHLFSITSCGLKVWLMVNCPISWARKYRYRYVRIEFINMKIGSGIKSSSEKRHSQNAYCYDDSTAKYSQEQNINSRCFK